MGVTPDSQGSQCHHRLLIRKRGGSEADGQKMLSCWLEDGGGRATNQGCSDSRSWKESEPETHRSLQRDQTCPGLGFTPKAHFIRAATVISHRKEVEPGRLWGRYSGQRKPMREGCETG